MKNSSFRFTIRIGATGKTVEDAKSGVYDITDADDATLSQVATNIWKLRAAS